MQGMNLNSPTVQQMLRDNPALANQVGVCFGPPMGVQTEAIVQTGNGQSAQPIPIGPPRYIPTTTNPMVGQMIQQSQMSQPYADPYGMITGMGLANYQMPTYNFTGALASPGYRDATQPVPGGIPTAPGMMTIPGYSNPYMNNGFAVTGYDPRYANPMQQGYYYPNMYQSVQTKPWEPRNMEPERQRRYMNGTDEDRIAIDRGFDSANHQTINNERILGKMHIACMKYRGESEEAIEDFKEEMEERHAQLRAEDEEFNKKFDPFNLDKYQVKYKDPDYMPPSEMNIRVVKGGEVLCEMNGENGFVPKKGVNRGYELFKFSCLCYENRLKLNAWHEYLHEHAIERQYDHVGIIEFFNTGFGHIHAVERQREWEAMAHDVTKLYDQNEFKERLRRDTGRPQLRQKQYERSLLQTEETNAPTRKDQMFIPGGIPVPVGVPADVLERPIGEFVEEMPGVMYNESTGVMNITLPDWLDDGSYNPAIYDKINGLSVPEAKAKRDSQRRKDFLGEVNKM